MRPGQKGRGGGRRRRRRKGQPIVKLSVSQCIQALAQARRAALMDDRRQACNGTCGLSASGKIGGN